MALDVGRLRAELELDDTRFNQRADSAEARLRQIDATAARLGRSLRELEVGPQVESSARGAAQSIDRVESSARDAEQAVERVGNAATATGRDIARIDQAATQAAASTRRIEIPSGIVNAARRAAEAVGNIGQNAAGAASSGSAMGDRFVSGFSDKIGNLSSKGGPIAGSLLGVVALGVATGAALAKAISDGLGEELDRDIFQAQTRTTAAQAAKFAQAAAESYVDVFGESVEANLSTLKLSIQSKIIDPGATQRDAEAVVGALDTISTALDGEVTASIKAVSSLMTSGLAANAQEAFDAVAAAAGGSANKAGDLLETISEYSSGWANAGFSAQQALALIEQATDMGVDNADRAGDALREFGRRVTEEEDDLVEALNKIGLNGKQLYDRFAEGGDTAFEAFDEVFDKIRSIEDPVARNTAAMALLGDTAGDFIGTFTNWDPSEASRKFGETEGAAARLAGIISGNAATSVEGAMRSVSVIADQMKAALASAFGPEIQEWADKLSNNREGIVAFFIDMGNAAFEGGKAFLDFTAGAMRGGAEFAEAAGDMSASVLRSLADMLRGFDTAKSILGVVFPGLRDLMGDDISDKLEAMADAADKAGSGIADGLNAGADAIDTKLIPGLDTAQDRFNRFGENVRASAAYNDAAARLSAAINDIGVAADGSAIRITNWTGAIDTSNAAQVQMEQQIRGLVAGFQDQTRTGLEAGATVEELTAAYEAQRVALIDQLMATGMSNRAAVDYINTLGLVPDLVATQITQPGMPEAHYGLDVLLGKVVAVPNSKEIHTSALTKDAIDALTHLGFTVTQLPDGTVRVVANTLEAEAAMQQWLSLPRAMTVEMKFRRDQVSYWQSLGMDQQQASQMQGPTPFARADGKFPNEPMIQPAAGRFGLVQWAEDDAGPWEAFIPGAVSKRGRALQIWAEAGRRMGALRTYADGGIAGDRAVSVARAHSGEPYVYGGRDCSGYQSEITSALLGRSVRFTTDADFKAYGFVPGYDPTGYSIGTDGGSGPNGHMAGELFGTPVESSGTNGVQYGGKARGVKGFPFVYHLPRELWNPPAPAAASTGAAPLTERQKLVDMIVAEGRRAGLTDADIAAIVAAGLVESELRNLDYGPDNSVGYLQQRPFDEWTKGGTRDRMNPVDATRSFIEHYQQTDPSKSPSERVADVQRPREDLRGKYADRYGEAQQLVAESNARTAASPSSSSSTTGSPSTLTSSGPVLVEVTNWPDSLTKPAAAGEGERQPRAVFNARLFAAGGINEPMIGAPGDIRVWNEPAAGGEGYVPFAPAKRQRALAVWAEIGRRLGVPGFADGGLGFGGYTADDTDWMKPRNAYDAAALAAGLLFTAASGLSGVASMASSGTVDLGNLIPSFDTGSNDIPGLSEAFKALVKPLEDILAELKKGGMVKVDVDVDTNTGGVNASLQRAGIA
ncbi:phage tail tape measure protein [Nocardia sp. NPDC057455]|uniref:phage tail tape measure protein n=1 Tax=Nocardia sp. NPDC057455 TaxID=3346138 RepID=UPI00366C90B3